MSLNAFDLADIVIMTRWGLFGLVKAITIVAYKSSVSGFVLPPISTDVTLYSTITSTSTCSSSESGFACNTTCPERTDYPVFKTLLETESNSDIVEAEPELGTAFDQKNGKLRFDNKTGENEVSKNLTTRSNFHFTLTFWIKTNCSREW